MVSSALAYNYNNDYHKYISRFLCLNEISVDLIRLIISLVFTNIIILTTDQQPLYRCLMKEYLSIMIKEYFRTRYSLNMSA